jgi:hypothetical protein
VATDEELLGESAPERWATPEGVLSAEEAKDMPLMQPKGDLLCRHKTITISVQW